MNKTLTKDEILKLKAAFLYVLNKNKEKGVDMFHVFKIMYFAEREHLSRYGRKSIRDTFYALPNGPVPGALYDIIKFKQHKLDTGFGFDETAYKTVLNAFDVKNNSYNIFPLEKFDEGELSQSDMHCLDNSYNKYINIRQRTLSDISHDSAWQKAMERKGKDKRMSSEDIALAGEANQATIEQIRMKNPAVYAR
ncbi:MAG: Panacea domain-containing protein [Petrimonas sp.]|nr:Panacea domain-containing protein [Petrimonas sp.]